MYPLSYGTTDVAPVPPPKPIEQESSRQGTPASLQGLSAQYPPPPPPPPHASDRPADARVHHMGTEGPAAAGTTRASVEDPGDRWLPKLLQDKTKQDLAEALQEPRILAALAHSHATAHPSTLAAQEPLVEALDENVSLATHLNEVEARLVHLRASTQAQLLATHALERQWRQKQSEMDRALSPFSPSSLYQRLSQGVQEQEMVCQALEVSFLDGDGGLASEREINEWVKRYRDAKKVYYSRRERKERWDEGRVGGWR